MKRIESTLHHIVQPPAAPGGEMHPTLILLHGRGADEQDLIGLADYFDDRFLVISARAPYPFSYGGGFTWYDISEIGKPDPIMFAESYRKLNQFLDDIKKGYPVDARKIFLLGFSMGTMMSYSLALTQPEEIKGVIANSGYIPEGTTLHYQWEKLSNTSFFLSHGIYDSVIPVAMGRRARMLLEEKNATLVYHEYPIAHQISEESLNDMARWLTEQL